MNPILYTAISHSLLPMFKLQFLEEAVKNSPEGGDVLEIGCFRGGSSLVLANTLLNKDPDRTAYICDTFQGIALAGEHDNYHVDGNFSQTSEEQVSKLLRDNGSYNFATLKGIFPYDTAHKLPQNNKYSVVHIDVDVYQGYKECLNYCVGRLLPGAYIVLDDFGEGNCKGATKAVFEFLEEHNEYEPHFTPDCGYGINYLIYKGV